ILFAATYPKRCRALVLYGAFARCPFTEKDLQAYYAYVDKAWGSGASVRFWAPSRQDDTAFRTWWGRFERLGGSPASSIAVVRMAAEVDVSGILPSVHVPTLVIHPTEDSLVNVDNGRFIARTIPGARLIELPGRDHLFSLYEGILDATEEFLTGSVSV